MCTRDSEIRWTPIYNFELKKSTPKQRSYIFDGGKQTRKKKLLLPLPALWPDCTRYVHELKAWYTRIDIITNENTVICIIKVSHYNIEVSVLS